MKTGLIIPCYNEASRLKEEVFIKFILDVNDYHLCFVNDGSTDNTLELLKKIKTYKPEKVSVIDIKKNTGKASAVRAGMRYLFHMEDVAYAGYIDADLSTNFEDFEALVNTIKKEERVSVVFGSRSKQKNDNIKKDPFRKLFSTIIKYMVAFILKLPIKDTQCGAKVFRRNMIPLVYNTPFLCKWLFDVEIFIRLKKYFGAREIMNRIIEQPLMRWEHVEDSKLGIKDAIQIPYKLFTIWMFYNWKELLNIQKPNFSYKLRPLNMYNETIVENYAIL